MKIHWEYFPPNRKWKSNMVATKQKVLVSGTENQTNTITGIDQIA